MNASPVARLLSVASSPRPAVFDASGTTSWAQLADASERAAAALLGGRASLEGERVALLAPPGAAFAACFFGVLRAGGAAVVLSPLHPPPEVRYFCDDAGVRTVVASAELAGHVAFLAPERDVRAVDSLLSHAPRASLPDPRGGDAALQLHTSGTTGKPKGAVLTHANLAVQQDLLREAWGLSATDVLLHVLPVHHMHGLAIAWLPACGAGAATRFVHPFQAAATWEAMRESTVFMAVPTIHAKLFAAFDDATPDVRTRWAHHARRLRLVTSGSAALPVALGDHWRELTGAYPLERFGMTEVGVAMSNPLDPARRRPGTVGLPLPTVQTRVSDGELWIAGPSVFAGYHGKPDATREAFVEAPSGAGAPNDEPGTTRWFKTGDTVSVDDDGYVRVLGRTSVDILKSGGYKLSALEIEDVLREHAAVAEVAVVGVPDPTWGERVVACVVPRPGRGSECTEDALRAFARERLAPYKVPKQVVLVQELPRSAVGKVMKGVLKGRL